MDKLKLPRPFASHILMLLLFVIGIGALISGPMLFLSPDGSLMKLPADTLNGTPFGNFIIPGVVLFLFVGVFPVLVAYGLLKKPSWRWAEALNINKNFHWSWTAAWAAGVIMLIWIAVETTLLGYISFLQPLIAVWGAAIITLTLLPATRRYYILKREQTL